MLKITKSKAENRKQKAEIAHNGSSNHEIHQTHEKGTAGERDPARRPG